MWRALQKIPLGRTATYSEIARELGQPKAVRAVAQACAANNLALLVPCHRVIREDGDLAGYRWGLDRKRALLEREREAAAMKPPDAAADRVVAVDWPAVAAALDERGYATAAALLSAEECRASRRFIRTTRTFAAVSSCRVTLRQGEYKYFRYPLPAAVEMLRQAIYPSSGADRQPLARKAPRNAVSTALDAYLADCHRAGQDRPTPLILKYGAGDSQLPAPGSLWPAGFSLSADRAADIRRKTLPAVSSYWSSSGRGCSRAARWCRYARAKR